MILEPPSLLYFYCLMLALHGHAGRKWCSDFYINICSLTCTLAIFLVVGIYLDCFIYCQKNMSKRTPSTEIPLPASFSGKNNFIVIKFSSSYIYDGPCFGAYSSTLNF